MPATLSTERNLRNFHHHHHSAASAALEEFHEASDQALPDRNKIIQEEQRYPPEAKLARDHAR